MSDKEIKQAATAEDAAEPAKKKAGIAKKSGDAAKTAAKVAETAAKVAEAAAKVAEAAALVAESAKDDKKTAAKKPAAKKAEKPLDEVAATAEKKPAVKKAEKPLDEVVAAAENKPAVKKPASKKADKPSGEVAAAAENKPAVKKPVPAKAEVKAEEKTVEKPAAKAVKAAPAKKYSQDGRHRLYARYKEEIVPALVSERGYKNVNQAPKLDKIVLNMRLGDVKDNSKSVQTAIAELAQISGQKPIPCKAKKSVANFKVREGMVIGAKVTLRGFRAYEFLDKLISIALPRVRDFRGVSGKAFDGRGNYALGVKEQIIFPEISYELVEKLRGFDIAIITTAKTDDEAKALLTKMGMPFRN